MTGDDVQPARGRGDPGGPRWSLDLLADLHAGVFDDEVTAALLAQAAADPQARATLDALDATRAALAALPPLVMPDTVASRIAAALQAEATDPGGPAPPAGPDARAATTGEPAPRAAQPRR